MKTKLLLLLSLYSGICFSQTPIASFKSAPNTNFTVVTSTPSIDQSSDGANTSWSFNNLTAAGTNIDTYASPTAAEITAYPGTTEVLSTTSQGGTPIVNKTFFKDDITGTSITAISQGDITLNYSTANAFIGLFPLSFGYSALNTPVSGTFSYQGTNGTFVGTISITVDAYGALSLNDTGSGAYNGNATRLKLEQSLFFSVPPIFNNIGTLDQTSYFYYDNTSNDLVFRYNNANLVSAFLGINQTTETLERNTPNTLSTITNTLIDGFKLLPNPATDFISISTNTNETIKVISIFNITGQAVLKTNKNLNTLSVKDLPSGFYLIKIETESGKFATKKFIKK
ncbi:T9SS type A sorting domain-containing protein [uncultured Lacinutrix sp.]|uniref:T9SS type A sorting domain-containing protein n=1 Tax=uncultured Lacinutrix sp. TaxID=574032 RepID=UPI0026325908|nr:T9SS type A sorting domain-containing protein [uncultured Lacinutrix sp.]